MSIKVENLTKVYNQQIAVNAISFEINKGEIIGFLGPNGAGKSTTMKMLTGYITPTSGKAWVNDLDIWTNINKIKKIMGYLPEHNPLYKDMFIFEYLHFVADIFELPNKNQKVKDIVGFVGLEKEKYKRINQLSKGYRQRVGLAQAILSDPECLILDEPTTGLDPNQLDEIRKLIIEIGKEKTVMLSTHIMQEVEIMCQKAIIIHQGNIIANQSIQDLKNLNNTKEIFEEFDKPLDIKLLKQLPNITNIIKSENGYMLRHNSESEQIKKSLFQFAVSHQAIILSIQDVKLPLEEVFKQITNSSKSITP